MARAVTEEHKQAMKRGRQLSAKVDAYLRAVAEPKRRGRRVSVEELERRHEKALHGAEEAAGVARLKLLQKAANLEQRVAQSRAEQQVDVEALKRAFIEVAAEYSRNQSIGYATWREAGVSAEVLKAAGIKQTRRRN